MSVAALAGDMAVLGTHHDVLVDGGLVHAPGQQLVLGQAGAIGGGAGIAGAKGDVTGSVLIEEGAVEQRAAAVDGAGRRHQRHFADAPCALVGVQQPAQKLRALVCTVLHDAAILEGDMEALDELAVEDVGLGAVDDAVHLVLVGCGEDLFGGDVGQEDHALFTDAGSTLPGSLVGDADGQIRAVAALEMDALEVEGVHLVLQAGQTVEVGLPLVDGVAARHAADIENELPELLDGRIWKEEVNVRDFIQKNYTPYDGDESFLAGPTEATDKLWGALQKLQKAERAKGGVLDMETEVVSGLTAYGPGYIDESLKEFEQIVGLQTDKPLKRAFMPYGGIKMAEQACTTYGYQPSEELHKIFTDYTRTHNQAVFDAYTPEMKAARHTHIITGLPDTYGRGRIVGDYRRVALYGIDALIKFKQEDFANCGDGTMTDDVIRLREEIARQISALKGMKKMAEAYGYDISQPAKNAKIGRAHV